MPVGFPRGAHRLTFVVICRSETTPLLSSPRPLVNSTSSHNLIHGSSLMLPSLQLYSLTFHFHCLLQGHIPPFDTFSIQTRPFHIFIGRDFEFCKVVDLAHVPKALFASPALAKASNRTHRKIGERGSGIRLAIEARGNEHSQPSNLPDLQGWLQNDHEHDMNKPIVSAVSTMLSACHLGLTHTGHMVGACRPEGGSGLDDKELRHRCP